MAISCIIYLIFLCSNWIFGDWTEFTNNFIRYFEIVWLFGHNGLGFGSLLFVIVTADSNLNNNDKFKYVLAHTTGNKYAIHVEVGDKKRWDKTFLSHWMAFFMGNQATTIWVTVIVSHSYCSLNVSHTFLLT